MYLHITISTCFFVNSLKLLVPTYELSRSLERLKKAKSVETLRRAPPVRVGELGNVKKV
jgi:hypothetical protein